jgi:hypothetical protein
MLWLSPRSPASRAFRSSSRKGTAPSTSAFRRNSTAGVSPMQPKLLCMFMLSFSKRAFDAIIISRFQLHRCSQLYSVGRASVVVLTNASQGGAVRIQLSRRSFVGPPRRNRVAPQGWAWRLCRQARFRGGVAKSVTSVWRTTPLSLPSTPPLALLRSCK